MSDETPTPRAWSYSLKHQDRASTRADALRAALESGKLDGVDRVLASQYAERLYGIARRFRHLSELPTSEGVIEQMEKCRMRLNSLIELSQPYIEKAEIIG